MKIRIMGNTLRVRVSQSEVDKLDNDGVVEDLIQFPGGNSLKYRIMHSKSDKMTSDLRDNAITIEIPQDIANEWVNTDLVSLKEEYEMEDKGKLSILIEKDFKCLTKRPGEDESDLFPNPAKSH